MAKSAFMKAVDERIDRLQEEDVVELLNHVPSIQYYDHIVSMGLATCQPVHGGQILRYRWQEPGPSQLSFLVEE